MKVNVIKDLSTLTTVNEVTFSKLASKIEWLISDCIEESILNKDDHAEIDLGFGVLLIKFDNNEVKYKFKPSQKFEKTIINTIINERNDLTLVLENSLKSKLENTYKSFF